MSSDKKISFMTLVLLLTISGCKKDELHWARVQKIETGTTSRFNRILTPDGAHILIFGGEKFLETTILRSYDSGISWQLSSHPDFGKGIYGAAFAPGGKIYLDGFRDALLVSTDTGRNYKVQALSEDRYFTGAAFPSDAHGILISSVTNEAGAVVHIDSLGHTLSIIEFKTAMNDVRFTDSLTGYLAGYGVILKTLDGGYSWQYQDVHSDNFMRLFFLDKSTIFTCGWGGSVYKTANSGSKWESLRNGDDISQPRYHLHDMLMLDSDHGYCVGEKGIVIYTDDAGKHWSEIESFTSEDLNTLTVLANGNLLIAGSSGALYRLQR